MSPLLTCLSAALGVGAVSHQKAIPDVEADLAGRVAIVTGGGAVGDRIGNGRAAAIVLARSGVRVFVVDPNLSLAHRTMQMISDEGGIAEAYQADVTRLDECATLVNVAVAQFGRLDFLYNNFEIRNDHGVLLSADPQQWNEAIRANINSIVAMSRYAIPAMLKMAGRGAVVNVSSVGGIRPRREMSAYAASKEGVASLTGAMAADHGPSGIRVNCVVPLSMYAPAMAGSLDDFSRQPRRNASVLGIDGISWDVGYAAKFLFSEYARCITGQSLVVDGGVSLPL